MMSASEERGRHCHEDRATPKPSTESSIACQAELRTIDSKSNSTLWCIEQYPCLVLITEEVDIDYLASRPSTTWWVFDLDLDWCYKEANVDANGDEGDGRHSRWTLEPSFP